MIQVLKEVLWVKCSPKSLHAMEKPFIKARVNNVAKLILKKLSHAPQLLATMTLINQQPITLRTEPPPEKIIATHRSLR